jgi:SAM-dependent methyltransferase
MSTTSNMTVDPSNADALHAWDGVDGTYWTENEAVFDAALERYDAPFFEAGAFAPGDRVLDIGCGNGKTTREAARRVRSGSVVGVDLSSQMIERARLRAAEEGVPNVTFIQADAQIHAFDEHAFDVVISRTGAMFFGDPVAAFTNIARALRVGGRLVLLVWQELARNHWIRDFLAALAVGRDLPTPPPNAPGPFSLAHPERVHEILSAANFTDIGFDRLEKPMFFGANAADAFSFVRGLGVVGSMLRDLDDPTARRRSRRCRRRSTRTRPPTGCSTPRPRGSSAPVVREPLPAVEPCRTASRP